MLRNFLQQSRAGSLSAVTRVQGWHDAHCVRHTSCCGHGWSWPQQPRERGRCPGSGRAAIKRNNRSMFPSGRYRSWTVQEVPWHRHLDVCEQRHLDTPRGVQLLPRAWRSRHIRQSRQQLHACGMRGRMPQNAQLHCSVHATSNTAASKARAAVRRCLRIGQSSLYRSSNGCYEEVTSGVGRMPDQT